MFRLLLIFIIFLMVPFIAIGCSNNDSPDQENQGPSGNDEEDDSITISVDCSRVSGVAPLAVFFDATGTTGLTDNGFFSDNGAYMDATFAWDFDADDVDPDGNYERGSGFLAAHVFEQPGTYRVHLDVYDAAGTTASTDITITVTDFSGNTYYVAEDGADDNDGSITNPFLTPEYALKGPHMQPNTRILFARGDTFYTDFFYVWEYSGPVIIDSYEDPDDPSDAKPIIYSTEVDNAYATFALYTDDWRVMNLAVRSGGNTYNDPIRYPSGITFSGLASNNLKLRTEEYMLGSLPMSPKGQYNTIAECEFYDLNSTGYTSIEGDGANDGAAIIGNWVHDKTGDDEEHIFRLQGGSRYFIAHNTFGPNILVNYDAVTIRGDSEKVVIYRNRMEGWVQSIWPQNRNSAEEYQHHCIMDANLIVGQGLYPNDRMQAIGLHAKDIVIRNNIIVNYNFGIGIGDDTVVGPSQRIKVYNNTFINPAADETFNPIWIDDACFSIDIKNNIMLDIGGGTPAAFLEIRDGGTFDGDSDSNMVFGSSWDASPNLFDGSTLADWQSSTGNDQNSSITDPLLVAGVAYDAGTDYSDASLYMPQTGSPVIDAGEFTSNALDYNGDLRDDSHDIGAFEYAP